MALWQLMDRWKAVVVVGVVSSACFLAGCKVDPENSVNSPEKAAAPESEDGEDDQTIGRSGEEDSKKKKKPEVGTAEKVAAAVGLADGLPDLKPVLDKPFPEGASEEVVCEAIENTDEEDLWVRFGHIVPMHIRGALYVLDAGPEKSDAIKQYIQKDYVYPHRAQLKTCGDRTLLYLRSMFEKSEFRGQPFGRKHLGEQLAKRLGVKTIESFGISRDAERLSDYCRADAELCEKLVKLDYANGGKGLCTRAISWARIRSVPESELFKRCRGLPRGELACTEYALDSSSQDKCRSQLKRALQPR